MSAPSAKPPRDAAQRGYNVYQQDCPARQMLDRLADKWSLLILTHLRTGPGRFNQLRRDIGGISQKALSQSLRKLERDGLVNREAFATVPVTVEYSLTALGLSLAVLVDPLAAWAEASIDTVLQAQRNYDQRHAPKPDTH
ncbi:winged helix-turn-helix transcriptional regulator [Frateuria aurantia]|uniref:Putative transcriptional regulator n=1 Tax=Frateuria aurantia (strain ATCC 33424 / DSM 6220 / KCTC 2777 / LMG 1558 / NBRC 3245 / NCIMB 13370) TaxID=767434 RepID=H8L6P7_FRAAD|nr:helix-turn-helix domain-containing protein [Frateuria aurantia]AFC86863.1 putative transcriptional regulator [Frateuria aurantia DSM 6220]